MAVGEGKIFLDGTMERLGVDDKPPTSTAVEKRATVRDLLESRSGIYRAAAYETKGMFEQKPARGSHAPGTFWYYNNWDFNALGFIHERATGTRIFDAFYNEIARPIGMQDCTPRNGHYVGSPDTLYPAYVFDMTPAISLVSPSYTYKRANGTTCKSFPKLG